MNRPIRIAAEPPRMASTIKVIPKKQTEDEVQESRVGQGRPVLHRYRLQVDRQTKSSFEDKGAAEKAAKAIKTAHPVVQVTVYDAEKEERIIVQADWQDFWTASPDRVPITGAKVRGFCLTPA